MEPITWNVDGVKFTLKPSRAPGKPPWLVWRDWHDDTGYPQVEVEWVESPEVAFEKYPGSRVQMKLEI